jgi:hypothetical protein
MEYDMTLQRQLCGEYRTTDRHSCPVEDSGEQRILERSDLVSVPILGIDLTCGVCVLQGPDIGTTMKLSQFIDSRRRCFDEAGVVEPAENSGEIDDGRMTHDTKRVIAAERGPPKDRAADETRRLSGSRGRTARLPPASGDGCANLI